MQQHKFKGGLGYKLSRAAKILQKATDAALSRYQLSRLSWTVLASVEFDGINSPGKIAKHIGLERTAVSRMIAQLEKDGFVQRLPSDSDGRGNTVVTTDRGRALCEEIPELLQRAIRPHVADLSANQIRQLSNLLDLIDPGDGPVWSADNGEPPL